MMHWQRVIVLATCAMLLAVPFAVSQDAETSMEQAKRLYRNGNYRGALTELAAVTLEEPDRADALYLTGYSHLMLREYPEAVDAFSRAFALDPTFDPRTIYQPRPRPSEPPE